MINPNSTTTASNQQQQGDEKKTRNPVLDAGLFSKVFFLWLRRFFSLGLKRPIEESDIYSTLDSHRTAYIGAQFDKLWKRETIQNAHSPSFLRVIIQLYGLRVLCSGLLFTTLDVICRFVLGMNALPFHF